MSPKVARVSIVLVTVADIYTRHFAINVSNVNMSLSWIFIDEVSLRNLWLPCAMKMSVLATLGSAIQK